MATDPYDDDGYDDDRYNDDSYYDGMQGPCRTNVENAPHSKRSALQRSALWVWS